jgi:integrase
MPNIFKPAGSKNYVVFYTDHTGRRRKKTLKADHETSERIVRDLLNKVALRKDGLIDERDEKFAEHERRPLTDHVEDFVRAVEAKGATANHVLVLERRVRKILDLTKIRRISELSLSRVQEGMALLRQKRSQGTINTYTIGVKSFARWLWRDKRAREHYLIDLACKSTDSDRRHVRRMLSAADTLKVILAAEQGRPTRKGFSGRDRAMLYRVALGTGFRASELRSLTPDPFRLNANPPTITALACFTKNGKEAVQPIAVALAEELKPWLAGKPAGTPVFEGMSSRQAQMLRIDLKAAGVPYETDDGVVDFHSLRGDYISALVSSGASVKECQVLARHHDPSLTIGIYAKTSLYDIHKAVERLPDLTSGQPEREQAALRATGTDSSMPTQRYATDDVDAESGDGRNLLSINELRLAETPNVMSDATA